MLLTLTPTHSPATDLGNLLHGASVEREQLWTNRTDEHGPFDIIGDVHGCFDELRTLLDRLGYVVSLELSAATGVHY